MSSLKKKAQAILLPLVGSEGFLLTSDRKHLTLVNGKI